MSVYFRLRKYENSLGQTFFLNNGKAIGDLSRFLVGDTVHVMFPVEAEIADAINALERSGFTVNVSSRPWHVHIACKVVERNHGIVWERVGSFQMVSSSITLEAEDGHWEDVLLWVTEGRKPEWAE